MSGWQSFSLRPTGARARLPSVFMEAQVFAGPGGAVFHLAVPQAGGGRGRRLNRSRGTIPHSRFLRVPARGWPSPLLD